MKIENVFCYAYFGGEDGLGTCDDRCQWFVKGIPCPQWIPEEYWNEEEYRKILSDLKEG